MSDIEVTKEFTFDSAHYLPGHPGKCAAVHGHTYRLQVTLACDPVCMTGGMVLDFGDLSGYVHDEIIRRVDHKLLNEVLGYVPTAENMAIDFFGRLEGAIDSLPLGGGKRTRLASVRLWETPTSYAEYRG